MLLAINWIPRDSSIYLEDWMLPVFLFSIVLITWSKVVNQASLKNIFSSVTLSTVMAKESANQTAWTNSQRISLLTVFFLTISLFLSLATKYHFPAYIETSDSVFFFTLLVLFTVLSFGLRLFLLYIIKLFIGENIYLTEYSFSIGQYNRFLGFVLLPITILIVILPKADTLLMINIGIFILALVYLIRIIKLIINSLKIKGGLFYIILYLCTFEFLPIIVAYYTINKVL